MTIAPTQEKLITGEEFLALGDMGPCELVQGRIVPMSTNGGEHGLIEAEIVFRLKDFNRDRQSGWVLGGEAGVYTRRKPDTVRGMDAAFISKERHPARPKGYLEVAPELIVEVVSPNDRWKEIQGKLYCGCDENRSLPRTISQESNSGFHTEQRIKEYFDIGVESVWLIEPEDRVIFIYSELTEVIRLGEDEILRGEGPLTGFALPLAELFAE